MLKGVHKCDMGEGAGDKDMEPVGSPWVASKEGSKWEGGGCSDESLEQVGKQSDLGVVRDELIEGEVGVVIQGSRGGVEGVQGDGSMRERCYKELWEA